MKKPLNYWLQMYPGLPETVCTYCWFWCIFWRFVLFFARFSVFLCGNFLSLNKIGCISA